MNEMELIEMVQKNSSNFKILLEDRTFDIDNTGILQTDNPITKPMTRGGVYFEEMKNLKVEAIIRDTTVSRYLSKAMLGPNKDFLDIELRGKIEDGKEICLITNLTNSMQNASKVVLYLTLKDAIIES